MFDMSAAMAAALRETHTVRVRADLMAGSLAIDLPVTNGDVTVDGNAAIRRRCSLTVTDTDGTLTPENASSPLTPFGNELRLYRGVLLADGTEELIPLGVFVISEVKVQDTNSGLQLTIEGLDRASRVQRARFPRPYTIAAGTNYGTAIKDAITYRNPWAVFESTGFAAVTETTPQIILGQQTDKDPWKELQAMAAAIGRELFFDPEGVCTLRSISTATTAVWDYSEGADAMILGLNRKLTSAGTYNHVVVSGEATSAVPVFAEASDTTVGSPTNVTGPFGDVVYFFSSPLITTQTQAQLAADTTLARVLGRTEMVDFPSMVNPAHDAGDAVTISRAASKIDSEVFILDSFNVPLSPGGTMKATARSRQV